MRIGIVGAGIVGNATAACFEDKHEVRRYDLNESRRTHSAGKVLDCDLVFVCLPTPQKEGSLACDTTAIDKFFQHRAGNINYVLRSTVPIGYTKHIVQEYGLTNLVHSPEFLTARTAVEDANNPTRLVIGDPTYKVLTDRLPQFEGYEYGQCTNLLKKLYEETFNHTCDPDGVDVPIHIMTSDESEMVKLMQNAYSAVKVAFFNEARCLADAHNLDWDRCMAALLAGGWINPAHTQVPGPDGKRGFGGSCLPKDLANFIACMTEKELRVNVSFAALNRNEFDRETTN